MPLLDPSTALSDETVHKMLVDQTQAIEGILARLEDPSFPGKEPLPLRTAVDLGRDFAALVARSSGLAADRAFQIAMVNLAYDTQSAMIDVMKMHSDLPKVPRR